jgi:hypothetical protein
MRRAREGDDAHNVHRDHHDLVRDVAALRDRDAEREEHPHQPHHRAARAHDDGEEERRNDGEREDDAEHAGIARRGGGPEPLDRRV